MRAARHQRLATRMASNETAAACSAALDYVRHGWSVIPVAAHAKRPLIMWLDFQQRLPTVREINSWFRRWPLANVGIVTGAESDLIVLDIDPKHGGADSVAALERRHGALPATIEALTGGGGRHLYFAHPGGVVHDRVAIESGIDLRGVDPFVALDFLLCWNATRCRPPLPEHEVVRTIESIARLHLRDEQTRRELR